MTDQTDRRGRWLLGAAALLAAWRGGAAAAVRRTGVAHFRSRWDVVHGRRMHARVPVEPPPDAAPAVVLVHGAVISSLYMLPTALRLAGDFRVAAVDLPGYGLSEGPRQVLAVPALADRLIAWMDAVGLARASLVANSLGCQVGVEVAARFPGRVERLVLVGPTVEPAARRAVTQLARLALDAIREHPSLLLIHSLDDLRAGPRRIWKTLGVALDDRIEDKLPHVVAPTLVVRGARDPIVPQRWAEEVARLVPDARLAVVPGAAHAVNFSAPDALAALARPFLLGGG